MKRNLSLDILRIVCATLVVFIHVSPAYTIKQDSIASLFLNPIFRVALPLFFMLSGYLILNKHITSLGEFYRKRLKSILIPFVVFSFVHYAFFHQWDPNPYSVEWLKNYFLALIKGYPVNTNKDYFMTALFWFVYTITGLYIITPIIIKCLDFIKEYNSKKSIIIIICLFAFQQFSPGILKSISISPDWFRSQTLNCFLVYFILGGLIARVGNINKSKIIIIALTSYLILTYQQFNAASGGWFGQSWFDANVFMMILCVSILTIVHTYRIEKDSKVIIYLSSLTYGVYLIQAVTISIADRFTHGFKGEYIMYTFATGVAATIIAFILSALANLFIKRL